MSVEQVSNTLVQLVHAHGYLAAPVVCALAFAESLIFLSWLIPASVILIAIGAVIAAGDISPWPVLIGGAIGAALGEWVSFLIGFVMKDRVKTMWPVAKRPDLFARGSNLISTWGIAGIFASKFIGPLRGIVPLMAGALHMCQVRFQLANWTSSLMWSAVWLSPGYVAVKFIR